MTKHNTKAVKVALAEARRNREAAEKAYSAARDQLRETRELERVLERVADPITAKRRAGKGEIQMRILNLLSSKPGLTASQIGVAIYGEKDERRRTIYVTLARMSSDVVKKGGLYRLAGKT